MTHPIVALQSALVAALKADPSLTALVGDAIFDAPPRLAPAPCIVIARHDLVPRDGDAAPGSDHRVVLHLWHSDASRKAVLAIADRVLAVVLDGALAPAGLAITNCNHERTDTAIDLDTGAARAALTLRFFTEASA
ncbi:MAG TPA: DUF3168 domain-containing protein [Devosiaceae bacterium]|nr:DUF3168 domain-containing protein [Devosiaceae bacterium]